MLPTIIENYTDVGIDVGRMVRRILSNLSPDILDGLKEVRILDKCRLLEKCKHPFACYNKGEGTIEIYVSELLGDFPQIISKVLYPITYMGINRDSDYLFAFRGLPHGSAPNLLPSSSSIFTTKTSSPQGRPVFVFCRILSIREVSSLSPRYEDQSLISSVR